WASGALVRIVVVGPVDWTRTNVESLKLTSATVRLLAGRARSSRDSTTSSERADRREASLCGRPAVRLTLGKRNMREPLEECISVCPGEWLGITGRFGRVDDKLQTGKRSFDGWGSPSRQHDLPFRQNPNGRNDRTIEDNGFPRLLNRGAPGGLTNDLCRRWFQLEGPGRSP